MTTNPSTQADAAMQRIRQHINRSAGQHLRAVRSASPADTPSMTPEPLLLATERLHRVDASQLPHGTGVSLGHCRTDMGICMGHPECADRHCQGHPCNDSDEHTAHTQLPGESRSLLGWLAAIVVFGLMAGAMALMGKPHDF